jgi:hypothetical protein
MYLVESVAPNVSSPFTTDAEVVGSKDTATRFCLIVPCAKRVSVTVGMVRGFDRVSDVKSAGPILRNTLLTQTQRRTDVRAHPKIPSEGFIPEELNAAPMAC